MSWRCEGCGEPQPAGTPLRRHPVLRADRSIEREVPLCAACVSRVTNGAALALVLRPGQRRKAERAVRLVAVAPPAPVLPPPAPVLALLLGKRAGKAPAD